MRSDELTIGEFLLDRLGRYVFQAVFIVLTAIFLYATGTESGIIMLLLCIWLLLNFEQYLWDVNGHGFILVFLIYGIYILLAYTSLRRNVLQTAC